MVNFVKSLIGWAFKPKIIIIGLLLFLLLIFTYFFMNWYVMNEVREKAFKYVKPSIDTTNLPLTYKDYLISQSKNKKNSRYYKLHKKEPYEIDSFAYDNYFETKENFLLLNKLIKKLDKNKKVANSINTSPGLRDSYEFNSYCFYYNKYGKLVYIQTNQGNPYALYDKQGILVQVKVIDNYNTYYFNNRKQFIFYCGIEYCRDSILYVY